MTGDISLDMKFLLIVVDNLRTDHLGCYSYGRDTSPNIDSIAGDSATFERCYATDIPTQPSFAFIRSPL